MEFYYDKINALLERGDTKHSVMGDTYKPGRGRALTRTK